METQTKPETNVGTTGPARQVYNISELFNLPVRKEAKIEGLAPGLPNVPRFDDNYVFDQDRIRELTIFWAGGFKALMIEGDPAAGKTSLVEQWHARLNVPLYSVACAPTTESYKLIGQLLPTTEGKLKWHDGPLVKACREGTSVLLDEYNTMDPGETTALNMALEGKGFIIPETGERITPHVKTRFFVTQNHVDSQVMVAGRNIQDVANDDRFCYMQVDYIKPDLEKAIVERLLKDIRVPDEQAKTIADVTVTVANKVRSAFREGSHVMEKPLSTRAVMRWAKMTVMYQSVMKNQGRSGLHYALPRAVRMGRTMADAVNEMITLTAGFDENNGQG